MRALIKKELRLSRKLLLVWMGLVLLLCGFAYFEYLSLRDSLGELADLIQGFPAILKVMFGVGEDLTTTLGWYGCIYFWVSILAYSYAVYLGASCVAKEQVQGTSEYLFTKPISRGKIVSAKSAACVCNLLILAAFCGLCNYFTAILPLGGLEQKGAAITTTIGLFFTEVVLFAVAFLISSFAGSYKQTVRLGAGSLLGFYGIYVAAECFEIPSLYYLTPLKYFDVYTVAKEGVQCVFVMIAAIMILVSVLLARRCWEKKEIKLC